MLHSYSNDGRAQYDGFHSLLAWRKEARRRVRFVPELYGKRGRYEQGI